MRLPFRYAVLLRLYGAAWRLARPFLRRAGRLKEGFAERLVPDGWPGEADPYDLWIQSASAGEAYLAVELLPHLRSPQGEALRVLLTTCTRQGLDVLTDAQKTLADNPRLSLCVRYFPLDQPDIMDQALALARPRAIVLLETELWPGLLLAAAKRRVPVVVLNGRMSESSLSGYRKLRAFWPLVAPARVAAISDQDARLFDSLFFPEQSPVRSSVLLNIKFDRVLRACAGQAADLPALPAKDLERPPVRLLFASVREEEEGLLFPVLKHVYERQAECALLVAPRHMHRMAAWQALLDKEGIPYVLRSALQGPAPAGSVILWDIFGELNALYAACHVAFVGGSLADLGGQNFLEPLAHGCIPLVGPYLKNFAWIGPSLQERGLVTVVADAPALEGALFAALEEFTADPAAFLQKRAAIRRQFAAWARERVGGSAQAAALALSVAFPVGK